MTDILNITVPVNTTILAGSSLVITIVAVASIGAMDFSLATGEDTGLLSLLEDI